MSHLAIEFRWGLSMRRLILMLGLLLCGGPVFAQSTSTDSQTLQALLAEVRQLRMELRNTTAAAQRVQILLYRLEAQETTVAHASQRLEETRLKLTQIQDEHKHLAPEIKRQEDIVSRGQISLAERNHIEDVALPQFKARLEALETEEQQRQANVSDAENQLRIDQAKLTDLQDQLEQLQRTLESLGGQASSNPH